MAEYIEKRAALDAIWQGCGACAEELEQLPVVEIVRCGECKFYTSMIPSKKLGICSLVSRHLGDDGFCSEGERKRR